MQLLLRGLGRLGEITLSEAQGALRGSKGAMYGSDLWLLLNSSLLAVSVFYLGESFVLIIHIFVLP